MVVRCSEIVLGHAPVRVCGGCNRVGLQARLSSVVPASARGAVASVLCALRIPSWFRYLGLGLGIGLGLGLGLGLGCRGLHTLRLA